MAFEFDNPNASIITAEADSRGVQQSYLLHAVIERHIIVKTNMSLAQSIQDGFDLICQTGLVRNV